MRESPSRLRAALRWTGTASVATLVLVWAASNDWWMRYDFPNRIFGVGFHAGALFWEHADLPPPPQSPGVSSGTRLPGSSMEWWFRSESLSQGTFTVGWGLIPLWIPILGVLVPTAFAWRTQLKRRAPNACGKCGYDRTGIPLTAPCPECGASEP